MNPSCTQNCNGCSSRVVCRCLSITEDALIQAIEGGDLETLREVRKATGAGTGCMCCHGEIRRMLESRQSLVVV